MKRLPKNIHGMEVRKLRGAETRSLSPALAYIINEYMYDGKKDDHEIEKVYFSCEGNHIVVFDGPKIAAYAKMINLPHTNTAYFSMLACAKEYKGTGLFTSSLMLSLGQGLEWGNNQVACITANSRVLEKFAKLKFVYDSDATEDRELAKKIAWERFGPRAELIDGFILNGTVLESYPNVPVYEHARNRRFNDLFKPPFIRDRCDRRLMFRRFDKDAKADYDAWLRTVE